MTSGGPEPSHQADLDRIEVLSRQLNDPNEALAAVISLGSIRLVEAANALLMVDIATQPKAVRKEARRQLHRLRSLGIRPFEPAIPSQSGGRQLIAVLASNYDPSLARMLQIYDRGSLTGTRSTIVLISAFYGITEVLSREVRHDVPSEIKLLLEDDSFAQSLGLHWKAVSPEYAKYALRSATKINTQTRTSVPPEYLDVTELFHDVVALDESPMTGLVRPVEIQLDPSFLEESVTLFAEPEIESWDLDYDFSDHVREDLIKFNKTSASLPEEVKNRRLNALMQGAYDEMFVSDNRQAYKRALVETAYIFWSDGRQLAARRAMAVAFALDTEDVNPFTKELLLRSVVPEKDDVDPPQQQEPPSGLWLPS